MKFKSIVTIVTIFIMAGTLISFYFLGPSLLAGPNDQKYFINDGSQNVMSSGTNNAITRENALTGTSAWKIPMGSEATTQIQAFAGATSVKPGKSIVSKRNVGLMRSEQLWIHLQIDVTGIRDIVAILFYPMYGLSDKN